MVAAIGELTQMRLPELVNQHETACIAPSASCPDTNDDDSIGAPNSDGCGVPRVGVAGIAAAKHRADARPSPPATVFYSDFLRDIRSGSVNSVRFEEGTDRLYYDVQKSNGSFERKSTRRIKGASDHASLLPLLEAKGIQFGTTSTPMTAAASRGAFTALVLWLPMVPLLLALRSMVQSRGSSKSRDAKQREQQQQKRITFSDVAGVDAAQTELVELVECLTQSQKYKNLQARFSSLGCLVGWGGGHSS